jgi:hypothetical protein
MQGGDGVTVMEFGFMVSAAEYCALAGQLQVLNGLGFIATSAIVIGEFHRDVASILSVSSLSSLGDPTMEVGPVGGRHAVVQDITIEAVKEPK